MKLTCYWSTAANTSLHSLHRYPPQPWNKINPPLCICAENICCHTTVGTKSSVNLLQTAATPHIVKLLTVETF